MFGDDFQCHPPMFSEEEHQIAERHGVELMQVSVRDGMGERIKGWGVHLGYLPSGESVGFMPEARNMIFSDNEEKRVYGSFDTPEINEQLGRAFKEIRDAGVEMAFL